MKNRIIFPFFLIMLTAAFCKQAISGTYDYSSLKFDSNKINIFRWDSSQNSFPKFSEPLALTNYDLQLTDSLLTVALATFNQTKSKALYESFNRKIPIDSFKIDQSKYKRQYFPYKDNNGQRTLELICFSCPFPEWRQNIYYAGVGAGIKAFRLMVNLSNKTYELSCGSYE